MPATPTPATPTAPTLTAPTPATLAALSTATTVFAKALAHGIASFREAGVVYAKAITEHGQVARDAFTAAVPKLRPSTWRRLEMLGRGALDERLILNGTTGASALVRLPFPLQKDALDNGVELLTTAGDTLRVEVDHLTAEQSAQVIAIDHIRSLAEQRAYVEAKAPLLRLDPRTRQKCWRVVGGKVRITHPCELTRVDLANMLAEMG